MAKNSDLGNLRLVLLRAYAQFSDNVDVSPALLATTALVELDPDKITPQQVYIAAHLQLRHISRQICREKFGPDSVTPEYHPLFPELQPRYPAAHSSEEDPVYRSLANLTDEDYEYNLGRMRKEISAKTRHYDAFAAHYQSVRSKRAS